MSILFDALNKAARDYRRHQAPSVVPLLRLYPVPARRIRLAGMVVIAVLLAGFVFGAAFYSGSGAVAKDAPVSSQQTVTSSKNASAPTKRYRKTDDNEPSGISLSAESLAFDVGKDQGRGKTKRAKVATQTTEPEAESLPVVQSKSGAKIVVTKEKPAKRKASAKERRVPSGELDKSVEPAKDAVAAKDWGRAIAAYNQVLKKDSKNQAALKGKIYALEQRGGDDDLDALDEIAERNPKMASVHAARARILVRQKDTMEALTAWKKAVSLEPQNKDYKLGLAILNDKLGRADEALKLYRQVPKPLSPDVQKRLDYLSSQNPSKASPSKSSQTDNESDE